MSKNSKQSASKTAKTLYLFILVLILVMMTAVLIASTMKIVEAAHDNEQKRLRNEDSSRVTTVFSLSL